MHKKASLSIELSWVSVFTVFANFLFDQKTVISETKIKDFQWAVGIMKQTCSAEKALALDAVRFRSVPLRCKCVFKPESFNT